MAIKPKDNYPGKIDTTDPNYPEGKAQNVTAPGDGTGTPWEEALVNDILGFQQKLLAASGVAPSGNPDSVAASDYFDALEKLFSRFTVFTDTGAANAAQLAAVTGANPGAYSDGQRVGFYINANNTGAATLQVAALGAIAFQKRGGVAFTGGELIAGDFVEAVYLAAGPRFELANGRQSGSTIQVVNAQDGAVNTGATVLPLDDSIPQNTEGDEYMQLAITPRSASSRLRIEVVAYLSHGAATPTSMAGALFRDAAVGALAGALGGRAAGVGARAEVVLRHEVVAGSVAPTVFKFRAGAGVAGTTTFNGSGGVRDFGGVLLSSVTITEVTA